MMAKISWRAPYEITNGRLLQPLSKTEGNILWAFMRQGGMTTNQIAAEIWGEEWDWPLCYINHVAVVCCNLRKKLKPFGWIISPYPGHHTSPVSRRWLRPLANGQAVIKGAAE